MKDKAYAERPLFADFNEMTSYLLVNFLNDRFEMDFYLTEDLVPDEASGYLWLDKACATALTYYLFSAFTMEDMYTIRQTDGLVLARLKVNYIHPVRNYLARRAAGEFLVQHPPPLQGFSRPAAE